MSDGIITGIITLHQTVVIIIGIILHRIAFAIVGFGTLVFVFCSLAAGCAGGIITPTLFHSARTHPETQEIVQVLMVVNHHRHQLIFCICVTALASTAGGTGQSGQLSQ